jgi:hypothetical protein
MRRRDPARIHEAMLAGAQQRIADLKTRGVPLNHPDWEPARARLAELEAGTQ